MTAAGIRYDLHAVRAPLRVFSLIDAFARAWGTAGTRPRPIGPVRLLLLADRAPRAERTFTGPAELVLKHTPAGYAVSYGRLREAAGGAGILPAAGGSYRLRVCAPLYQRVEVEEVRIPATPEQPDPFSLALQPSYLYPFPTAVTPRSGDGRAAAPGGLTLLYGSVLAPDGSPVAGAAVTTPEATAYRTTEDGQWVLVFAAGVPGSARVDVTITVPGAAPMLLPKLPLTPGRATVLPQTALRGRILATREETAAARVRVEGAPATVGARRDGAWRYYFPPDQRETRAAVTAVLPDGRALTARNVPVVPRRTGSVPDFRFPPTITA